MEKGEIRKTIRTARRLLSAEEGAEKSRLICGQILRLDEFQSTEAVYVYMDCKGEVSTRPLIEAAWRLDKKVAAPRVNGENMVYYYIHSYEDVAPGYYDIPEPVTEEIADDEKALLIVPGVGFDAQRNRCGYGKGFYDRYLAAHTQHTTVAVAFEFQIVDEVPARKEDIRPQYLITERRILSDG